MYVSQMDEDTQQEIRKLVEESLRETGIYTEEEIQENVEDAINSKIADLSDTINISKYIK